MACAAFTRAPPVPQSVVTVTKHRAGPAGPVLTYMNVKMQPDLTVGTTLPTPATTYVSRSGGIVDDVSEYYVGVQRMRFTLSVPYIVAPPKFVGGSWDRATGETAWELGIKSAADLATVAIKIPPAQRSVGTFTSDPDDYSCSFQSISDWVNALNEAAAAAFALLAVKPTAAPFFSVAQTGGTLQVLLYNFADWAVLPTALGTAPPFQLVISANSLPAFSGWDLVDTLALGTVRTSNPDAFFIPFLQVSNGSNYLPQRVITPAVPAFAGTASAALPGIPGLPATAGVAAVAPDFSPAVPTESALVLVQNSPSFAVPGCVSLNLSSTMPINPEYSGASSDGKGSVRLLTDFSLTTGDVLGSNRDTFVYDASGLAGVRWLKLMGGATLTEYTISASVTDWRGKTRAYLLRSPADAIDIKLVFAPADVVES